MGIFYSSNRFLKKIHLLPAYLQTRKPICFQRAYVSFGGSCLPSEPVWRSLNNGFKRYVVFACRNIILLWGLFLFVSVFFRESAMATDPSIVGRWFFYKKIYRGVDMPEPPEATLRLFFTFTEDGYSHLYWYHEGEHDWCERKGHYYIDGDTLIDKITWVNPKNTIECGRDPDMQYGRSTRTPIGFVGEDLHFYLTLGDDSLVYVWKRLGDPQ